MLTVSWVCVALLASLLATVYLYIKWTYSYWRRKCVPFKPPSFPFGNFTQSFTRKVSLAAELEKLYAETSEPFIGLYSTLQPVLLVRDPRIIKDILIKNFQSFNYRGYHASVHDPMADNILLQQGDKWNNARRQFSPAFSSSKVKAMFDVIVNCTGSMKKYVGT